MLSLQRCSCILLLLIAPTVHSQSTIYTYSGYTLTETGDQDSVIYDTSVTHANVSSISNPPPDVSLNASVLVGEIDLLVANLSAKINLDAQVLNLLEFNAGVTAQVDRVQLVIQNITAYAHLEARLANLVTMIDDILNSIDLNPIISTLGQDVGNLLGTTVGGLTGALSGFNGQGGLAARSLPESFVLTDNILYSVNSYQGNTHTNRILASNGDIVDQSLNNDGTVLGNIIVGSYATDMQFNGFNETVTLAGGQVVHELEYDYAPIPGLSIVAAIFQDPETGAVVNARVLAEARGGGYSTIE